MGSNPWTAARLRGRIEAVLNFAKAHRLRSGENPAAWRGHLALILPKRQKLRAVTMLLCRTAMFQFIAKLRETNSIPAMALEFLILTAAQSGEVLGAKWSELDLSDQVWIIPANRMKAGVEHRVPLAARAIEIVKRMAEIRSGDFVFPWSTARAGTGASITLARLFRGPERCTDSR